MNTTQMKRLKIGTYTVVIALLFTAVLAGVNLLIAELPSSWTRVDISRESFLELSDYSVQTAKELKESVHVYVLSAQQNRDGVVEELLSRYEDLSSKIDIDYVDLAFHPDFAQQFTSESVEEGSLIFHSEKRNRVVNPGEIYYSLVDENGEVSQTVFNGETAITGAFRYVTAETVPTVCRVVNHGEVVSDALDNDLHYGGYAVTDMDLSLNDIPTDCGCLLISCPDSDLTATEVSRVLTYLEKGGNLLLISPVYSTRSPNLFAMMQQCGAVGTNQIVMEGDSGRYVNGSPYYAMPIAEVSPITESLGTGVETLFIAAHPIVKTQSTTWSYFPLFSTSEYAYCQDSTSGTEREGPFQLGVLLHHVSGGQVIWYSSPSVIMDSLDISNDNEAVFMASLDVLCEKELSVSMGTKSMQVEALTVTDREVTLWSVLLIGVLPLGIAVAGVLVTRQRKRRV